MNKYIFLGALLLLLPLISLKGNEASSDLLAQKVIGGGGGRAVARPSIGGGTAQNPIQRTPALRDNRRYVGSTGTYPYYYPTTPYPQAPAQPNPQDRFKGMRLPSYNPV